VTNQAPVAPGYGPLETWYYNGIPLSTSYYNVATFGGSRFGIPTNRGADYEVPYRSGQLFRPKYLDERTITLTMWTDSQMSANQSYPAADPRRAFNDNWQALRALFTYRGLAGSQQGTLTRNWYLTQAGTPQLVQSAAMAEVAGSMDPTMNGRTSAAFSVDLLLSDPYFYGTQRSQAVGSSGGGTITALGEGIVGEGFFSAVNAFYVAITTACTVTNQSYGVSFTHSGAGVQSWPVTVDVLRNMATDNAGNNVVGGLTHAGSRMWMTLLPGANVMSCSAGTATLTWNDAYI
jgi:hypothetical protein